MNRIIKLIILMLLSTSVYFIYNKTKDSSYTITSIGDNLSLGINSYGIKEYSYVDYYKEYLETKKETVKLNKSYSNREQSLSNLLKTIKLEPNIKKELLETDKLILTLGYNDLVYNLNIEDSIDELNYNKIINKINKDYNELIKEIRKYYKEEIIVIGYYQTNNDYYFDKGIKEINKILKNNEEVTFIDTENILIDKTKYFSNPNSYYPNRKGYFEISNKIITKTLEK